MNWDRRRSTEINLKLIELIKPHGLIHRRAKRNENTEIRSELWNTICTEMNRTYNLDRSVVDWRTKFRSLRKVYCNVIHGKKHIQNKLIMDQLDFLRPLIGKRNDFNRRTSKRTEKSSSKNTSENDGKNTFSNSCIASDTAESIVVDISQSEYDFPTIDGSFEIFKIEDDDDIGMHYGGIHTANINDSLEDSQEEEGDGMFGALIAEKLREMTTAAQKELKRNISELLYS